MLTSQMSLFPTLRSAVRTVSLPRLVYPFGALRQESTLAQGTAQTDNTATTHFRVTLRRSAIGLPKHAGRVLESLGLHKRLQSVYHRQSPDAAGAILAVKELVHVENVRALSAEGEDPVASLDTVWVNANGEVVDAGRVAFKAPKGFRVVGNLVNEERDAELKQQHAAQNVQ